LIVSSMMSWKIFFNFFSSLLKKQESDLIDKKILKDNEIKKI
jgi:hypothetical protein